MALEQTPVYIASTGITLSAGVRPGDYPPVICLHGIWDDGKYFEPFALAGAFPGRTMYLFDLRGHGESDKPESGYALGDYAEDIIAFIIERRLEDVVLVGHSLGALTSLLVAAELPDRVGALLLEDPPVPLRVETRGTFAGLLDLKRKDFETVVEEFLFWRPFMTREQAEGSARRLLRTADGVLEAAAQDLTGGRAFPPTDAAIPAPALVIQAGFEDQRAFGSEGPELLGAILPNLRIETIPETSHNILREKPDEYLEVVNAWWDGVKPPT